MAETIKFANNATSLLVSQLEIVDTIIHVTPGEGSLFPILGVDEVFYVTLENEAGEVEICKATARTADDITVSRAQEGTSALVWLVGDRVECRLTSGILSTFTQGALPDFNDPVVFNNTVTVVGTSTFQDDVTLNSNAFLTASGGAVFTGTFNCNTVTPVPSFVALSIVGPLSVLGAATFSSNVSISGALTAGSFSPSSISTGALSATTGTFSSTATFNATSVFNGAVTFNDPITFGASGQPSVIALNYGSLTAASTFGTATFSNAVVFAGATTTFSSGTISFTNGSSGVSFNASTPVTFNGNVIFDQTPGNTHNPVTFANLVVTNSVVASGGDNGVATTLARSDHTHTLGGQNTFLNIDVDQLGTFTAASPTDTLHLVSGPNVQLIPIAGNRVQIQTSAAIQNAFLNIAVDADGGSASGAQIVAGSSAGTATLVAGSNITLTSNPSNDTILIEAAGGGGGGGVGAYGAYVSYSTGGNYTLTWDTGNGVTNYTPVIGDLGGLNGTTTSFGVTLDTGNFSFIIASNGVYKIAWSGTMNRTGGSTSNILLQCRQNGGQFTWPRYGGGGGVVPTSPTMYGGGRSLGAVAGSTFTFGETTVVADLVTADVIQLYLGLSSAGSGTHTLYFSQLNFDIIKLSS